jgi:hypothetical protein
MNTRSEGLEGLYDSHLGELSKEGRSPPRDISQQDERTSEIFV